MVRRSDLNAATVIHHTRLGSRPSFAPELNAAWARCATCRFTHAPHSAASAAHVTTRRPLLSLTQSSSLRHSSLQERHMAQQRMRSSDSLAGHRCAVLQGTAVGRRQRRVRGPRRAFMIRADGQLRRSKRHMFEAPPGNHLVVASGPAYSYSARRQHHSSKNSRPTPQLHPQPHSPSTRGVPQLRRRLYHSAGSGIPQRGDATRRYMCHTLSRHPLLRNLTGRSPPLCHPRPPNPSHTRPLLHTEGQRSRRRLVK